MSSSSSTERRSILLAFGAAMRAARLDQGISQEELGFRSGLDRTYVSGVERGVRNPTLAVLARIANGLEVTLAELIGAAEEKLPQD